MLGSQNSNISELRSICQELYSVVKELFTACLLLVLVFQNFEVLPEVYCQRGRNVTETLLSVNTFFTQHAFFISSAQPSRTASCQRAE